MNFQEAIQKLREGKKIRRKCWTEYKDAPKYFYLGKKNIHNQNKASVRLCNIHSLEADDWEIVEDKKEKFFCQYCKSEVKFGDKFCRECGKQQLWALFG